MKKEMKLAFLFFMLMTFMILLAPLHSFSQDNNCVCAECGRKCGDGHDESCSAYQKPPGAEEDESEGQASELNDKGLYAYRNGNWVDAIRLFKEALTLTPNDYRIQQNLQNAERQLEIVHGQEEEAAQRQQLREQLRKAHDLNLKGVTAYQNRNWAEACNYFREALRFSPNDAVIRQNLQNAEQSLKNAEAQELARQQQVVAYQQLQAEANSLNEKGSAASREGKWAEAINYYQEALKLTPDSVVIRQSLLDAEHNLKNAHAKESAPQKPIAPGKEAAPKGDFAKDNHELVNSLKGRGPANPQQLALKKSNPTIILPGWNPEELSNPQIYRIAKNLDSIKAPPPPLPAEKVTLEWSQLAAENSGVILKVVDSALLVWDIGWHVSKKASFLCTAILIGGKTVLAGEEGAFIFLTKKNEVYESALKYLKNPETAKRFVELHKEFKATGNVASKADQDMITAVKAISDPSLGSSGMKLAWDAMLSPEARVAMIQKACIEIGSALFVQGSMTHSADLARRKEIFDSIRLERNKAVSMLKTATDQVQQFELNRVITHANKRLSQLYHVYGAGPKLMGFIAGNYLCDEAEKTLKEK